MKHTKENVTGKTGVIHVQKVVNDHGSIFHPVHEENDLGVDGFIELVKAEVSSCRVLAVQVKSGDSYLSDSSDEFVVNVDERHLDYWLRFMLPVILVCYSPTKDTAAWVSVRDYVEHERCHKRLPVTQIRIPFSKQFNAATLSEGIAGLAHVRADERLLIKCADMCMSDDVQQRHDGFQILANHPDSRRLRITCLIARRLVMDPNIETAKSALHVLGYSVGRNRWSWNPNNREEGDEEAFARKVCEDVTAENVRRLLELCDDAGFHGPAGLGERLLDVIGCCFDTAEQVLNAIARDASEPMKRRAHAVLLLHGCDDGELEEARDDLLDSDLADVIKWMLPPSV